MSVFLATLFATLNVIFSSLRSILTAIFLSETIARRVATHLVLTDEFDIRFGGDAECHNCRIPGGIKGIDF